MSEHHESGEVNDNWEERVWAFRGSFRVLESQIGGLVSPHEVPRLAGQEKCIQACARLLMSVNNKSTRSLGPKICQSPSPNLTLPVDSVHGGLLGELQHKVVLHRYEYKTKNGSSSLWWCVSTLKRIAIRIWRDGSVGKLICCVSLRNWIQISSTLVKSQAWSECLRRDKISGTCWSAALL